MNVGIIGVGKLGLAYALLFEQRGFNVVASSYKEDYVTALQARRTDQIEPGIKEMLESAKNIEFTVDNHQVIDQCDLLYVLVATPSTPQGDYDVKPVWDVVNDIRSHMGNVRDKVLIVGSTCNPGTCVEIQKELDDLGVHVVYCPTFAMQGAVISSILNAHTLSLGTENDQAADRCRDLFSKLITPDTPVYQVHPTTGEILKLAGNCRATMEISFFNMMGQFLINAGMEKDLDTASKYLNLIKATQKFHFGFGFGGPCYPRDNRSFVHYAKSQGMDYPLGEIVDSFNESHVEFLTDYFIKQNSNNLPYYFEYVSYKKGVNIFEESHQLKICRKLLATKAKVYIEPTVFLLPLLIEELKTEFGDRVEFVSKSMLTNQDIVCYDITT
jgi:nucleotide sugar dehydrogenase